MKIKSQPLANKFLGWQIKHLFVGGDFTLPTWNKNYPLFSVLPISTLLIEQWPLANVNMSYHAQKVVLRYSELFEKNCDEVSVDVLCIGNIIWWMRWYLVGWEVHKTVHNIDIFSYSIFPLLLLFSLFKFFYLNIV